MTQKQGRIPTHNEREAPYGGFKPRSPQVEQILRRIEKCPNKHFFRCPVCHTGQVARTGAKLVY